MITKTAIKKTACGLPRLFAVLFGGILAVGVLVSSAQAQDTFPEDNGLWDYHRGPNYRESESHPLRIVAYVLHPIGWVAREAIFRPLSYFASSTPVTRSVMGYRDPYDFRNPTCFSKDTAVPDCHALTPYNYDRGGAVTQEVPEDTGAVVADEPSRQVYLPDVNFDFNSSKLNDLGEGRVHQIAQLLSSTSGSGLKIVLEGNADFVGTEKYNEKLGNERAEAVRAKLVALGIAPDRLSTVTFGESKPILTEQENWARAVNRRVALQVSEAEKAPEAAPAE